MSGSSEHMGERSQAIKPTEHLLGLKALRGDLLFGREFGSRGESNDKCIINKLKNEKMKSKKNRNCVKKGNVIYNTVWL